MAIGFPFPDLPALHRELAAREWDRSALAEAAGISVPAACRAVDGGNITRPVQRAICRAFLTHAPATSTSEWLAHVS